MKTVLQDLRYGVRMLWKNPGFTAVAVVALALGVAANTTIFSVVNTLVLRPLPYQNSDQLVMLAGSGNEASPADFFDWKSQNKVFERVAAIGFWDANLGAIERPERLQGFRVSADLFPMLGVQPAMGRAFLPEEEQPGKDAVVIVSHGLWQRVFNSDPNLIGKTLTVNGRNRMVVGIMPPSFQFYRNADAWSPLVFDAEGARVRLSHYLIVAGRLKPDVTLAQAQAEMTTIARRLEQQYPETNSGRTVKLVGMHENLVGSIRPALLVLLGAVGFVLLIACANVANLLLARSAARQKEVAVRVALGAGRFRIIRQLLTESALLAGLGGTIGLLLALWGVELLVANIPQTIVAGVPLMKDIGIDTTALGFTLIVTVLTGIVFGLAPALQISKPDLNEVLKEGGRSGTGSRQSSRLRSLLVVSEIALSLVLLIGAGLMIRSFVELMNVPPGFNSENILTMQIALPTAKYGDNQKVAAFYTQTVERIKSLPGVVSVGATSNLPFGGSDQTTGIIVEGRPAPPPGQEPEVSYRAISPDYFHTMGIAMLKGRSFTEQDKSDAPGAVIINETMARRLFGADEEAVGKRLRNNEDATVREIVGMVRDVRHAGLSAELKSEMFGPHQQDPLRSMTLVIRTASDPASFAPAVRRELQAIDPDQPVYNVRSMEQVISESVYLSRFSMFLLAIFAALAVVLAAVGIYGVMAYAVAQRTHELGIRMALGAQSRDIFNLVVGQGMLLTLAGIGIGLVAAFALTRAMASLLYGVSATDLVTFAGVSLLLSLIALLACYIPARRAMRVDPMTALRYE